MARARVHEGARAMFWHPHRLRVQKVQMKLITAFKVRVLPPPISVLTQTALKDIIHFIIPLTFSKTGGKKAKSNH